MSLTNQTTLRVVLYEGAGSQPLTNEARFATVSALLEKGFAVTRANGQGHPIPTQHSPLLVLGQFAGGEAPQLEDNAGRVQIEVHDISGQSQENVVQAVEAARAKPGAVRHTDWKPWFPVSAYARCTNGRQG